MRDATLFGYKNHKHGWGSSVIKGTLLEEQFRFSAVSQIYLQGFFWKYTRGAQPSLAYECVATVIESSVNFIRSFKFISFRSDPMFDRIVILFCVVKCFSGSNNLETLIAYHSKYLNFS